MKNDKSNLSCSWNWREDKYQTNYFIKIDHICSVMYLWFHLYWLRLCLERDKCINFLRKAASTLQILKIKHRLLRMVHKVQIIFDATGSKMRQIFSNFHVVAVGAVADILLEGSLLANAKNNDILSLSLNASWQSNSKCLWRKLGKFWFRVAKVNAFSHVHRRRQITDLPRGEMWSRTYSPAFDCLWRPHPFLVKAFSWIQSHQKCSEWLLRECLQTHSAAISQGKLSLDVLKCALPERDVQGSRNPPRYPCGATSICRTIFFSNWRKKQAVVSWQIINIVRLSEDEEPIHTQCLYLEGQSRCSVREHCRGNPVWPISEHDHLWISQQIAAGYWWLLNAKRSYLFWLNFAHLTSPPGQPQRTRIKLFLKQEIIQQEAAFLLFSFRCNLEVN